MPVLRIENGGYATILVGSHFRGPQIGRHTTRGPCLNQHIGTERPTCALWWQRCARIPRYRFNVLDTDRFDDEDGVILPDDKTARAHAMQIIHELQKADEASWSGYTMEVLREGRVVWRIPFEVSDP